MISVVNDEDEKWIYQRGSVCDKSFRSRLRRSGGEKGRNSSAICFQRLDVSQTGDQDRMYHLRASLTSDNYCFAIVLLFCLRSSGVWGRQAGG